MQSSDSASHSAFVQQAPTRFLSRSTNVALEQSDFRNIYEFELHHRSWATRLFADKVWRRPSGCPFSDGKSISTRDGQHYDLERVRLPMPMFLSQRSSWLAVM